MWQEPVDDRELPAICGGPSSPGKTQTQCIIPTSSTEIPQAPYHFLIKLEGACRQRKISPLGGLCEDNSDRGIAGAPAIGDIKISVNDFPFNILSSWWGPCTNSELYGSDEPHKSQWCCDESRNPTSCCTAVQCLPIQPAGPFVNSEYVINSRNVPANVIHRDVLAQTPWFYHQTCHEDELEIPTSLTEYSKGSKWNVVSTWTVKLASAVNTNGTFQQRLSSSAGDLPINQCVKARGGCVASVPQLYYRNDLFPTWGNDDDFANLQNFIDVMSKDLNVDFPANVNTPENANITFLNMGCGSFPEESCNPLEDNNAVCEWLGPYDPSKTYWIGNPYLTLQPNFLVDPDLREQGTLPCLVAFFENPAQIDWTVKCHDVNVTDNCITDLKSFGNMYEAQLFRPGDDFSFENGNVYQHVTVHEILMLFMAKMDGTCHDDFASDYTGWASRPNTTFNVWSNPLALNDTFDCQQCLANVDDMFWCYNDQTCYPSGNEQGDLDCPGYHHCASKHPGSCDCNSCDDSSCHQKSVPFLQPFNFCTLVCGKNRMFWHHNFADPAAQNVFKNWPATASPDIDKWFCNCQAPYPPSNPNAFNNSMIQQIPGLCEYFGTGIILNSYNEMTSFIIDNGTNNVLNAFQKPVCTSSPTEQVPALSMALTNLTNAISVDIGDMVEFTLLQATQCDSDDLNTMDQSYTVKETRYASNPNLAKLYAAYLATGCTDPNYFDDKLSTQNSYNKTINLLNNGRGKNSAGGTLLEMYYDCINAACTFGSEVKNCVLLAGLEVLQATNLFTQTSANVTGNHGQYCANIPAAKTGKQWDNFYITTAGACSAQSYDATNNLQFPGEPRKLSDGTGFVDSVDLNCQCDQDQDQEQSNCSKAYIFGTCSQEGAGNVCGDCFSKCTACNPNNPWMTASARLNGRQLVMQQASSAGCPTNYQFNSKLGYCENVTNTADKCICTCSGCITHGNYSYCHDISSDLQCPTQQDRSTAIIVNVQEQQVTAVTRNCYVEMPDDTLDAKKRFAYQFVKARSLINVTCVDFTQVQAESWKEVGINPGDGPPNGAHMDTNLALTGLACYSGFLDFSKEPWFLSQFYVNANGVQDGTAPAVPTQNAPSLTVPTQDAPALAAREQKVPGGGDDYGRTLGLSFGLPVGAALAGAALGRIPKA